MSSGKHVVIETREHEVPTIICDACGAIAVDKWAHGTSSGLTGKLDLPVYQEQAWAIFVLSKLHAASHFCPACATRIARAVESERDIISAEERK